MILLSMCVGLLGVAHAQEDAEEPPEPIRLDLTEIPGHLDVPFLERGGVGWEWQYNALPNAELTMRRFEAPTVYVTLGIVEGFQPAIDRLGEDYLRWLIDDYLAWEGYAYAEAPLELEVIEHPVLGKALVTGFMAVYTEPPLPELEDDLGEDLGEDVVEDEEEEELAPPPEPQPPTAVKLQVMVYAREGAMAFVVSETVDVMPPDQEEIVGLEDPEEVVDLSAATDEVLGMLTLKAPPMPDEELPTGRVEMDAGYALTLPEDWRALTKKEMNALDASRVAEGPFEGRRASRIFVEPATTAPLEFSCQVYATRSRPIEVLHHDKSQKHAENFRTYGRVLLKGGRFRLASGGSEEIIDVVLPHELLAIQVPEGEAGELDTITLGDREAYAWRVKGTLGVDEPVTVAMLYTAWDNLGLTCSAVAGPEEEEALLSVFDQAVSSLEILDAEEHPMVLSFMSRYRRWWPYSHPALQLYWLVIPLFGLALVPMIRDWRDGR